MSARAGTVALACAALVLSGCRPGDSGVPAATVTDSVGVRVVTYDLSGVDVPEWMSLGPSDLTIGVRDGPLEYAFSGVTDLAVTEDGTILVSDRVGQELRVYDATGAFVRALGGPGEGPGEFSSAPMISGLSGDTVWAFERRARRVTPYLLDGTLIEPLTLRSPEVERPLVALCRDDGSWVVQSTWINGDDGFHDIQIMVDSVAITTHGADGTFRDSVAVLADMRRARRVQPGPEGGFRVMQATTPYSERAFLLTDGVRTLLGNNADLELDVRAGDMTPVLRLTVDGVRHPATGADIRARQEQRLREDLTEDQITPTTRLLNVEFAPERLPAFERALFSETGDLWVSRHDFEEIDGTDWLVFSPEGTLRGRVRTPEGFRLRHIGGDHVVGVTTDDFDVPYVQRHPLGRPSVPS